MSREDKKLPVILIGGGGHATVLAEILLKTSRTVLAVVCPGEVECNPILSQFQHKTSDEYIYNFPSNSIELVLGVGKMPGTTLRELLISKFSEAGYIFSTVISPEASVSDFATIGKGSQVLPGAIINSNAHISDHVIVNSGAIVEHDCVVQRNVHIAPGSVLCGGVTIAQDVIVGPSAVIAHGCNIGAQTIIGAGCSIVRDVEPGMRLLPGKIRTFDGVTS